MSENEAVDFGDDAAPIALDAAFAQLDQLAKDSDAAGQEVERLEEELKAAKRKQAEYETRLIPELMGRMRLKTVTTISGFEITVKRDIRASLPSMDKSPELRAQGLKWLAANGQSGLIKNKISLTLDRGQDDNARRVAADLRERGLDPELASWVEPQTLSKCVRELLEKGVNVPFEPLGVFDQQVAKIKRK